MSARLLCLGHAAQDYIYRVPVIPNRPVKVVATAFAECGGGMAANAAVAAVRLGGHVEYWGRVADDARGARILADLAREGVEVGAARRVPGCRSPATSILISDAGERLICSYADPTLDADASWLPLHRMAAFDVVLADVRWPQGSARVLDAAIAAGRPALLDADVASPAVVTDLVGRASHVLFSEAGLEVVAEGRGPGEAIQRLQRETHALIGVTLGADGFLWRERDGAEKRVPSPSIQVVDTLAAGDVWHGAFALALGEGKTSEAAARFANAAAAIKCGRPGGRTGAPGRSEVELLLKKGW